MPRRRRVRPREAPTMHRNSIPAMALAVAALTLVSGVGRFADDAILAQGKGTEATPTSSSSQTLAEVSIAAPPPSPVVIGLALLTFAPGAGVANLVVSGQELLYVESG